MEVTCGNALCGKTFNYRYGPVHFARGESHYCSRSCQNTTHGRAGSPEHRLWETSKRRARKNGIPFTLTVHDVPAVPTHCPILGIVLLRNDKAGPADTSPSLDRIRPEIGYVPGNVRVISFRANRLRSDATAAELRAVADDAARLARLAAP